MINTEGGPDTEIRSIWWKAMALRGKQCTLPDRAVGTCFVHILAEEIETCNGTRQPSEKEFILTALVLQPDKSIRKGKHIRQLLSRRLDMLENRQLHQLLREAQRCDAQLLTSMGPMSQEKIERTFNRLMPEGRVSSAVRLITDRVGGGVLDPDDDAHGKSGPLGKSVYDVLQEKHPAQQPVDPDAYIDCDELPVLEDVHVTGSHTEQVARRLFGGAGPSGTNSEQWRSFLLACGKASARLREAVAASTRRHANQIVPWDDMREFLARQGIALDKLAGVRPIGVGECRQRIEAKAMALATGLDVQKVCGADQLCAGTKAGIEAAVHAITELFHDDDTEGLLLVDVANAFNSVSRPASLWNCRILWPRCSRFLFNAHRVCSVIILKGVKATSIRTLLSREGTTQGCQLAMLMYAIGLLPLITRLKNQNPTYPELVC